MKNLRSFFIILIIIFPYTTACSHAQKREKDSAFQSTALQISPPKLQAKPLIVVDPGHGGFDLGAQTQGCLEKELALLVAQNLKKILNERGYPVLMTRTRDVFIPLKQRVQAANVAKSALFVSLHFNAAKNSGASGIEIYYCENGKKPRTNLSKKLAQKVLSSLLFRTGAISRGIKTGNFFVIRETKMPAILIEGGFITHTEEGKQLLDDKYLEKISLAIAEGIDKYFR